MGHCCEHETIRDVFENIVHFLRAGWTHTKRKGCENTGSIGVGVSFVQEKQNADKTLRALSLGAKGIKGQAEPAWCSGGSFFFHRNPGRELVVFRVLIE